MDNSNPSTPKLSFTGSQVITICISFLFFIVGGYGLFRDSVEEVITPDVYTPHRIPYVMVSRVGFANIENSIQEFADKVQQDQLQFNRFLYELDYNFYHRVTEVELDGTTVWMVDAFLEYADVYFVLAYYCELDNLYTFRCTPLHSFS